MKTSHGVKKETPFETKPTWVMCTHKWDFMNHAELDRDKLYPFLCFSSIPNKKSRHSGKRVPLIVWLFHLKGIEGCYCSIYKTLDHSYSEHGEYKYVVHISM